LDVSLSGDFLSLHQNPCHFPSSLRTERFGTKETQMVKAEQQTVHIPGLHKNKCIESNNLTVLSISLVISREICSTDKTSAQVHTHDDSEASA
jgi:hypothetical protein